MTKSTITREQLEEWVAQFDEDGGCDATDRQLEALIRQSLAAMDSEPVAEVVSIYGDPEAFGEREIRPLVGIQQMPYGTKLYRHARPVPEYPETLPCPVLLEPGLRFSKGIKTITMLAALARRAVYESDMAALSPEERAEFQAGIDDFKALIAQPAPVVPEEITIETATIIAYGLPTTNIGAIFKAGHDACRAAMLKAQPQNAPQNIPEIIPGWIPVSEQKPDCWCLTCRPVVLNDMRFVVCPDCGNKRCPRANDHRNACTGSNEPGQEGSAYPDTPQSPCSKPATVPGKWIPVSERMPEGNGVYFGWDGKRVLEVYCFFGGFSANQFIHGEITHWMPLPAAPQEDINALIPLVSRNEREVK